MLRGLRRSTQLQQPFAIAIAAMVVLGSADWWHAGDDDDLAVTSFHDHAAHHRVVGTDRALKTTPDHCYLCHWLRTFHHGLRTSSARMHTVAAGRRIQRTVHARPSDLAASLLPARAPPA
jgi:hypothetical protein